MAFFVSLILTGVLIPKILLIAYRRNLFDMPDERKIHHGVVPRLGGIAFVPALIFAIAGVIGIWHFPGAESLSLSISDEGCRRLCFGVCALLLLYLVGISDDLIGVRYRAKFYVQLIAACFLLFSGLWINNLHGFCGIHELPIWLGVPLTLLVIVFVINAINLIDGIDGLASGLSGVALAFFGAVFVYTGMVYAALISFATLGTLIPFFYFNVFGDQKKRKKIFMGDTGSLCIGLILVYLALTIARMDPARIEGFNPLAVAFCPLLLPCFDVLRVFGHRIRYGNSPFLPDRTHIHHKLLAMGMKGPHAMISIVATSVLYVCANLLLSQYIGLAPLLLLDLLLFAVLNLWLTRAIRKRRAPLPMPDDGSFL